MKNIVVILITIGVTLGTVTTSYAHENSDLYQSCIQDCMSALNAADQHIKSLEDVIKTNEALQAHLERKNQALEEALDAEQDETWFEQPAVGFVLGIAVGALAMGAAQ